MAVQRRFGCVIPQAQARRRDSSFGQYRGSFNCEHRCAAVEHIAPMHQVPIGGLAIDGVVLAHGRHHNAVGKGQSTARRGKGEGRKQKAHGGCKVNQFRHQHSPKGAVHSPQ